MRNLFEKHDILNKHQYDNYLKCDSGYRPVMLFCETVNICNNDCIICAHSKMTRKQQIMDMPTFEKVLYDYSSIGGGVLSLTPVIGDIFIDTLLQERLEAIEKYNNITKISVTTNAKACLKYDKIELARIVNSFDRINVSMYGLDDDENYLITRKKKFRQSIHGLRRIAELLDDKSKLEIGFRLLKKRDDSFLKEWCISNIGIEVGFSFTYNYCNWSVLDTNKKLPYDATWLNREKGTTKQCLIPLIALQVYSDGNVSFCPCDDFNNDEELCIGNINNNTLIEIYNSEKTMNLWDFNSKVPSFCQKCTFFKPLSDLANHQLFFNDPIHFIGG